MNGTYIQIGEQMTLGTELFVIAFAGPLMWGQWRKGVRPIVRWWQIMVMAAIAISPFGGLSFELTLGLALVGGGIYCFWRKEFVGWARYAFAAIFLCMAPMCLLTTLHSNTRIAIRPDSLSYSQFRWSGTIPRSQIRMSTFGPEGFISNPWRRQMWFIHSSVPTTTTDLSRDDVYLGPEGLVNGGELAKRISAWAGAPVEVTKWKG